MMDIVIPVNARRFNIPTYIVRSKADQHIRSLVEMEEDEGSKRRDELYRAVRWKLIEETRNTVKANMVDANLPDQRVTPCPALH